MKTFVIPALQRFGAVSDLTASDFKCTPGGDGGFTYWDHGDSEIYHEIPVPGQPSGNTLDGATLLREHECRGVTQAEKDLFQQIQ